MAIIFYHIINWSGWNWGGWGAISAIVLAFTAIFIARQARATKIFTKYSVMPSVSFILRSLKTSVNRLKNNTDFSLQSVGTKEKLGTSFIIVNNSTFPILFKVKIKFWINGEQRLSIREYWDKPLLVSSKINIYPNVINLEKFIEEIDHIKDKRIVAHIEYAYAPEFAPRIGSKTNLQTWIFDLKDYEWSGPAGARDINMYLPGEHK
jgi:hypothetical protein